MRVEGQRTANVQLWFLARELLRVESAKSSQFHWLRAKSIGLYAEAVRFHSPGSQRTLGHRSDPNFTLKALCKDGRAASRRVLPL
jgi:hypothetical protein